MLTPVMFMFQQKFCFHDLACVLCVLSGIDFGYLQFSSFLVTYCRQTSYVCIVFFLEKAYVNVGCEGEIWACRSMVLIT